MSHSFFRVLRAHGNQLTAFQLAAEEGATLGDAAAQLQRYAAAVDGARLLMTKTSIEQQAQQLQRIEQRQQAKGMAIKRKAAPSAAALLGEDESAAAGGGPPGGVGSGESIELAALHAKHGGNVRSAVVYEAVFVFPANAETRYLASSLRAKLAHGISRYIMPASFFALQFMFGLSLLLSILAILTAIIILIILMSSREGGGGGGGGGGLPCQSKHAKTTVPAHEARRAMCAEAC